MTFTDDDLKRLKENTGLIKDLKPFNIDIEALLARLEAAERFCNPHPSCNCAQECDYHSEAMEAWRKASR